ncbi:hypothetical protein ABG067_006192 [Albugo candida]|uniref:1-(5-phosphoribosyl)-5-[(5-phosphoribosylamino)methylideneamino]imidazole-4-carboxamideisomerase n=1 Tax=Albugo candida TaxID=65357 RepID=A0A024G6R1_9STRA|nr:unnamed protein product [Albugo candida]|eukprot:CCI42412.1 unnamed protein product [Albugo candida]
MSQTCILIRRMYQDDHLYGGHVIMLGNDIATQMEAKKALQAYPNGLQIGGGINDQNCQEFLQYGASHVIVTSFMFQHGRIDLERLRSLKNLVGKEHLVLDLSCRKKQDGRFYVMMNRWQTFTDTTIDEKLLVSLAEYCDEFLVHAVDVEGKLCGIQEELVELLACYSPIPVTYAGGARSLRDMELVDRVGMGKIDMSIGSALDIFGGMLSYREVVNWKSSETHTMESEKQVACSN